MKYIVQTQIRENYAAHDSDYNSATTEDHWKYKGGNTYVFPKISVAVASNANDEFYAIIQRELNAFDDYYEEYVISEQLLDDTDSRNTYCSEWETPIICKIVDGEIRCTTSKRMYCNGRLQGDATKRETFVMRNGVKEEYTLRYHLDDGRILDWNGVELCLAA